MEGVPLAPEDEAILRLESSTIAGHTCKLVLLDAPAPDLPALRAMLAERIRSAPALIRRLAKTASGLAWVPDPTFDIASHVVMASGDAVVDRATLELEVARLFAERLDPARPLWRIDVLRCEGGGSALVWRVHHALADGTMMARYAELLLWDTAPPAQSLESTSVRRAGDEPRHRRHLAGFLRREFALAHGPSRFDGPIDSRRAVAFVAADLTGLHRVTRAVGATLNDAVLTVVVGALRHWLVFHHGHLGALRVRVPVSLHHQGDDAANRDSFFTVTLPLNEPDPLARLRATRAATSRCKADRDAELMDQVFEQLGNVSPALRRWCSRLEQSPRSFALAVSNVPGPRDPVTVLGAPVAAFYSLAEIGEHHALRVAVMSYADRLFFGICADPTVVDNLQIIGEAVQTEAKALSACV